MDIYELFGRCFPSYRISRETFARRLDLAGSAVLTAEESGAPAGFAVVGGGAILMLCVAPEYRRRGHGARLLAQGEAMIREGGHSEIRLGLGGTYLFQGVPDIGGAPLFFQKRGYVMDGETVDMRMDLKDFTPLAAALPPGVGFRRPYPGESGALLEAVREVMPSWLGAYEHAGDNTLIAARQGEIIGFCIVEAGGSPVSANGGSVGCVGVVPRHRCLGIGLAMVAEATAELKARGCDTGYIGYTHLENWYAKLGYRTWMRFRMGSKAATACPPSTL